MKFSYNWLKELSGTEKTSEELAAFLTMRAFEVEEVKRVGFFTPNIFVGRVLSVEKHPNADRLRVAHVDLGEKGKKQIVCGAPNLEAGQNVAVALSGAILPSGMEIRETEIRGVHSEGMICSEKELGLGENHDGIMMLPETAEIGTALLDVLCPSDFLLDVKILPDRAHDCLSHVGLAREISALEERDFDYDYDGLILPKGKGNAPFSILLGADGKSLRYIGVLVKNVSVGASPQWLVDRLGVFGMHSINNIVDATNLIMLELGQPLHAFDWDKLAGGEVKKIGPRFARSGETTVLLDGKTYELGAEDIVIADEKKAVALGGIMGGVDSAVTAETRDVFLEAAHFDPVSIRRTRTRLGIESDASSRFEKGISFDLPGRAMARLLDVISHIAGGEVVGIIDEHEKFSSPNAVTFSSEDIAILLGTDVSEKEMKKILELRGFSVALSEKKISATPPPFRLDIASVADIVEEVGKGIGYDRIESQAPGFILSSTPEDPIRKLEGSLRKYMAANGFVETYNYSFYSEADAKRACLDVSRHFALENPLNPDQALVRTTLLPGLLKNVAFNRRRFPELRMFECGKTYETTEEVPKESRLFSGIFLSLMEEDGDAFFEMKSVLARLFCALHIRHVFRPRVSDSSLWHPTRTADLIGSECSILGTVGEIHPSVSKAFGIVGRVVCFECDVRALLESQAAEVSFAPIRKYPETLRDLSCFVSNRTLVSDVERTLLDSRDGRVLGVELFDRYHDAERGWSLAFHLHLGKEEGTLSGEEADAIVADVTRRIEREIGGKVRKE